MDGKEFTLTPQEQREMYVDVKQTKRDVDSLTQKINDMHRIVAGNGRFKESLAGRLQILEERQEVGAEKQDKNHKETCDRLASIEACQQKHTNYLERNHSRISDLESKLEEEQEERAKLEEEVKANKATLAEWRNKAIGIGIGSGAGTAGVLAGIFKLIESLSGNVP